MTLKDLKLRLRNLWSPRRVENELDEELAFHLEQETAKLIAGGMTAADARATARARFGSVALAADECRDASGTAFVFALGRDVAYALRTFRRAPLAAATIIGTVALGLALVTIVFMFFNILFLRSDDVRDPQTLFAVTRPTHPGAKAWQPFTRSEYDALKKDTSVLADAVAMVRDVPARVDGRLVTGTFVTGNFFQLLGVQAALGRTMFPSDDDPAVRARLIVLSDRGWRSLTQANPAIVGQHITINGVAYGVIGVASPLFRGLSVSAPDYWAPLSLVNEFGHDFSGRERGAAMDDVVGRLKPGVTVPAATSAITAWAATISTTNARHPPAIELKPRTGRLSDDASESAVAFMPIFVVFGLVLLIGCANVANLLCARGLTRQREFGIRLSLGASRGRVVRQLLTESVLLSSASAIAGFFLSKAMLAGALYLVASTLPAEVSEVATLSLPTADWRVYAFLACVAFLATMLFGVAPAFQATRLDLVRTMRGEITADGRSSRWRSMLIGVQVSAAALLVICAGVFLRSAAATVGLDPGVRIDDTVEVRMTNEALRPRLVETLQAHAAVQLVSVVSPRSTDVMATIGSGSQTTSAPTAYVFASPEYFNVLGLKIVKGRGFSRDERSEDAGVALITDVVAARTWPASNVVGQRMRFDVNGTSRSFEIVGVVHVPAYNPRLVQVVTDTALYLPSSIDRSGMMFMLRVNGDSQQARFALLNDMTRIDPALGGISTLRTKTRIEAYILEVVFWITVVLGAMALALTVSGLFSVLSYLVEQRRREFGVRISLGATRRDVVGIVLRQLGWPVAIGLTLGGATTAAVKVIVWSMPISRGSIIPIVVHASDPLAYVGGALVVILASLTAALVPALRASGVDPSEMLKAE